MGKCVNSVFFPFLDYDGGGGSNMIKLLSYIPLDNFIYIISNNPQKISGRHDTYLKKIFFSMLQIKGSRLRESEKLTKYTAQLGGLCLSLQLYP